MEGEEEINAESLDQARLRAKGRQATGRSLGMEHSARMRFASEDCVRRRSALGDYAGALDHLAMPQRDAIGFADGYYSAAFSGLHIVAARTSYRRLHRPRQIGG